MQLTAAAAMNTIAILNCHSNVKYSFHNINERLFLLLPEVFIYTGILRFQLAGGKGFRGGW